MLVRLSGLFRGTPKAVPMAQAPVDSSPEASPKRMKPVASTSNLKSPKKEKTTSTSTSTSSGGGGKKNLKRKVETFAVEIEVPAPARKRSKAELDQETYKLSSSLSGSNSSSNDVIRTPTVGFTALRNRIDERRKGKGKGAVGGITNNRKGPLYTPQPKPKPAKVVKKTAAEEDEASDTTVSSQEDDDESYEEEEEEESGGLVPQSVCRELASDTLSKSFGSMESSEIPKPPPLRVGCIVSFDTKGEEGSWLGRLVQIRGRMKDITAARNVDGSPMVNSKNIPRQECSKTYLQVQWLYDAEEFTNIAKDARWSPSRTKPMGVQERVLTDHLEWKEDSDVIYSTNTTVYRFDDHLPYESTAHPLTLITHKKAGLERDPPLYFFGDDDFEQTDALVETNYIRADINLKRQAPTDVNSTPNGVKKIPSSLTFNVHSTSRKPYNPESIQIYSQYSEQWYTPKDLIIAEAFKTRIEVPEVVEETDAEEEDEDEDDDELPKKRKLRPIRLNYGSDELKAVAKSTIIRGGPYGLIGNEWIVREARSICEGTRDTSDEYEQEIVEAEDVWRCRSVVRGRGRKTSKNQNPMGLPPAGKTWCCPETNREI